MTRNFETTDEQKIQARDNLLEIAHERIALLTQELETEKFEHWQTQQVCNQLQQEANELHALNLYDLVGDADQLRADMVATIKERDELRRSLDASRVNIGLEIAKHAYTKTERDDLRQILKRLIVWIDTEDLPDELCTPEYLAVKQAARDATKDGEG